MHLAVDVNRRYHTGDQRRYRRTPVLAKEKFPVAQTRPFQNLIYYSDNWQRDCHLFGIQRKDVQQQKQRDLYWPQIASLFTDRNIVGQCRKIEQSAQSVTDEGTAEHEIGQVSMVRHDKGRKKRDRARGRKKPAEPIDDWD